MYTTITRSEFTEYMGDDFSRVACSALFDYIKELEESDGQDMEFDRIAIRCDFSEMSIPDILDAYDDIPAPEDADNPTKEEINSMLEWLDYHGGFARWIEEEKTILFLSTF